MELSIKIQTQMTILKLIKLELKKEKKRKKKKKKSKADLRGEEDMRWWEEKKGCPLAFVIRQWSLCVWEREKVRERASWMLWSRGSTREEKKIEKWR